MVLIEGKITPLFGNFTFLTENAARTSVRVAAETATKDFLAQAPENWRDWLKVDEQRKKLIEHWLKTNVQVVRLESLVVRVTDLEK